VRITSAGAEAVVESDVRRQHHEHRHPVAAVGFLDAYDERLPHLGQGLDRLVDIGTSEPDAHPVKGVVGGGTRHGPVGEYGAGRGGGLDVEELPERAPESLQVADRPLPQLLVVVHSDAMASPQPSSERRQVGSVDDVVTRLSQEILLGHLPSHS
jgi:hypothetical protein